VPLAACPPVRNATTPHHPIPDHSNSKRPRSQDQTRQSRSNRPSGRSKAGNRPTIAMPQEPSRVRYCGPRPKGLRSSVAHSIDRIQNGGNRYVPMPDMPRGPSRPRRSSRPENPLRKMRHRLPRTRKNPPTGDRPPIKTRKINVAVGVSPDVFKTEPLSEERRTATFRAPTVRKGSYLRPKGARQ